jgi:hypothetical protein
VVLGLGSIVEGGVKVEPTAESVGLGDDWANTVDLSAGRKKAKLCNARFTMAGQTLRATTRIFPGTEIVVGIGYLPCQLDPWMELRWLGVLVWGGETGYEGKECIGQVTKFNKSNNMFITRFEDGRIMMMSWDMVECRALYFDDGRCCDEVVAGEL